MTLIYWIFFYTKGSLHWNDTQTYVHPIFLYILPSILLLIELSVDQVMYYSKNLIYMLAIYGAYLPLTFIGKSVLGYYPYPFITWTTFYSYFMLISLGLLQTACFLGIAYVNNTVKRKLMVEKAESEVRQKLDQGLYNEVQMNMFKNAISEDIERVGSSARESKRGSV